MRDLERRRLRPQRDDLARQQPEPLVAPELGRALEQQLHPEAHPEHRGPGLRALGLDELVVRRAQAGAPVLGLCLGMQLLFERSVELGGDEGLGLLPGRVVDLAPDPPALKIPHIGWNVVTMTRDSPLTDGLPERCAFYHVHSFVAQPSEASDVLGRGDYGGPFVSIVARDPIYGVQFHPEKSSTHGLALLRNFTAICARTPAI